MLSVFVTDETCYCEFDENLRTVDTPYQWKNLKTNVSSSSFMLACNTGVFVVVVVVVVFSSVWAKAACLFS